MEAIILAGGFGTRLQSVVSDVPKPMAEVAGKPFLEHLLLYLSHQNINRAILAVGYKYEIIQQYFGAAYADIELEYVIEDEPLGTGGAIAKACSALTGELVYVVNGDTFFNADFLRLLQRHQQSQSSLTLALKPMEKFDRYGRVELDEHMRITGFQEKQYCLQGYINGGIYLMNKNLFDGYDLPERFSFETFMENNLAQLNLFAEIFDDYFIDIGIPEDYRKAQSELAEHYE